VADLVAEGYEGEVYSAGFEGEEGGFDVVAEVGA
jgi:hypothetical protein